MKKTIITSTLALGILTGCSGGTKTVYVPVPVTAAPTTVTLPPVTAPPTTVSRVSVDDLYIEEVRDRTTQLWSLSDNELLEFGYLTCSHFQNGGTNEALLDMIIQAAIDNGTSEEIMLDIAGVTGIAVAVLCPEYSWKLG